MLSLRSGLDDARGAGQLIATGIVSELHGMHPLLVAKIHGMRVIRPLFRNDQVSLTAVRHGDWYQRALHRTIGGRDRIAIRARDAVSLLDLLAVHRLDVP